MTLREFYKLICTEFNNGEPLEYKYTEPGGYWRMTKGFILHGSREISADKYLEMVALIKRDMEAEHKAETRSRGRPTKKVHSKYVGE